MPEPLSQSGGRVTMSKAVLFRLLNEARDIGQESSEMKAMARWNELLAAAHSTRESEPTGRGRSV